MENGVLKADKLPWFKGNNRLKDLYLPIPKKSYMKKTDIAQDIFGNHCKIYCDMSCPPCELCLVKRLNPHFLYTVYKYVERNEDILE